MDSENDVSLTKPERMLAIGNWVAFLVVITFNALGSTGAISGKNIGDISDFYATKFTPASNAFSIWALIYFGVAVWCVMLVIPSAGFFGLRSVSSRKTAFADVGPWFIYSCCMNAAWILLFVWETPATTWISCPFLFGLLGCLLKINEKCDMWNRPRNSYLEYFALDFTFSVYSGWATVASIVNVCAACVSIGWKGDPWTEAGWSCLMMGVAAVIVLAYIIRKNNSIYGLVYTWAVYWISAANPDDSYVRITGLVLSAFVGVVAIANIVRGCVQRRKAAAPEGAEYEEAIMSA